MNISSPTLKFNDQIDFSNYLADIKTSIKNFTEVYTENDSIEDAYKFFLTSIDMKPGQEPPGLKDFFVSEYNQSKLEKSPVSVATKDILDARNDLANYRNTGDLTTLIQLVDKLATVEGTSLDQTSRALYERTKADLSSAIVGKTIEMLRDPNINQEQLTAIVGQLNQSETRKLLGDRMQKLDLFVSAVQGQINARSSAATSQTALTA